MTSNPITGYSQITSASIPCMLSRLTPLQASGWSWHDWTGQSLRLADRSDWTILSGGLTDRSDWTILPGWPIRLDIPPWLTDQIGQSSLADRSDWTILSGWPIGLDNPVWLTDQIGQSSLTILWSDDFRSLSSSIYTVVITEIDISESILYEWPIRLAILWTDQITSEVVSWIYTVVITEIDMYRTQSLLTILWTDLIALEVCPVQIYCCYHTDRYISTFHISISTPISLGLPLFLTDAG